ncbi:negative elongation factor D-like [Rhopilema esculentum]|uniref:negative elongation factor D-like n=1 Tax=Rhopilema esculentum TaxID=499914 RepID=UPI0031E2B2B6
MASMSSPEGSWEDDYLQSNEDFTYEDQQNVLQECKNVFSAKDCIMEPVVHEYVRKFLESSGLPEEFVQLLADNYTGTAQAANLLADWLIVAGCDVSEVQDVVEQHLKDMILKHFDPKKADSIFTAAGQTPDWIEGMIAHPPWRKLFYELAEKNPDCLLLNFSIKLISDAGYQTEIGSMSSACNQIDVFARVLKTLVMNYINGRSDNDNSVNEIARAACHGKHTYLFTQYVLNYLSRTTKNGTCLKRLSQELQEAAVQSGRDVWNITMSLNGGSVYPAVAASLISMLSRKQLNPGDITTLYKAYSSQDAPSVELIRVPTFLGLLVDSLFKPGSHINPEHKSKYTYILGYSAAVYENWKNGVRLSVSKDELKGTVQAIDRVHSVCSREIGGTLQLSSEVGMLYQCIRYPVVAMGILRWVEECLSGNNYLKVMTDSTPIHLVLLDEVSTCHPIQHPLVLKLLIKLFSASYPGLETLVELEFKKTILDRLVHMLSRGYVIPVVQFIRNCMDSQITDISLIRHFVIEVLEMIAPPYSREFIDIFLPIVKNESITGILKTADKKDDVSRFLLHCAKG